MSGAALFKKDVRLAADAMGPWSVVLSALVVAAMFLWGAPIELGPSRPQFTSFSAVLIMAGQVLAYASVPFAAVIAASVLIGDGNRGAAVLHDVLPVSGARRSVSKLIVAGFFALFILLVALGVVAVGVRLSNFVGPVIWWLRPLAMSVLKLQLVAIFYVVIACTLTRSVTRAVMLSIGLVMAAALTGAVSAQVGIRIGAGSLIGALDAVGGRGWTASSSVLETARVEAAQLGVVAGGVVGALVAVAEDLWSHTARTRTRRPLTIAALAILATSAITAPYAVRSDYSLRNSTVYRLVSVRAATDAQLAEMLSAYSGYPEDLYEAHERIRGLSPGVRATSPVAIALGELEDYSTPQNSVRSLSIFVPSDDPRRASLALDLVARFPADAADIIDAARAAPIIPTAPTAYWVPSAWVDGVTRWRDFRRMRQRDALHALDRIEVEALPDRERLIRAREAVRRLVEANATETDQ